MRLLETIPGLRPGLSATAEIVTANRSRVLSVSIGALAYRDPAAEAKDFAEADRIRDALSAQGILIKDGPEGSTWEVAR